jgi:hypothetical protein
MLWELLKSLKVKVIVVAVIVWNAVGFLGVWLNGGTGSVHTRAGGIAMSFDCALLAFAAFSTAFSDAWQGAALRPTADSSESRPGLMFIGFLGTVLAVSALLGTFLGGHNS